MKKIYYPVIALIVIAVVFFYASYRKNFPFFSVSPTATTTQADGVIPFDFQSVQVDTSDWQTYVNTTYGYEFKYPKGWKEVDYNDNKYYVGMTAEQVAEQKKSYVDHKETTFVETPSSDRSSFVSVFSKGKNFTLADLQNEWKQTGSFPNYKMTQFTYGENTIIVLTNYVPAGTMGYKDTVGDVYIWLLDKNGEMFMISGAHNPEQATYIPSELRYVTGVYRTFKSLN